jgi:flagellar motor switch protein FliM
VLGKTSDYGSGFLELQPGDVLPLDTKVRVNLEVLVGIINFFYAKPCYTRVRNKEYSIKN